VEGDIRTSAEYGNCAAKSTTSNTTCTNDPATPSESSVGSGNTNTASTLRVCALNASMLFRIKKKLIVRKSGETEGKIYVVGSVLLWSVRRSISKSGLSKVLEPFSVPTIAHN
jgi:hypothetical protein